MIEQIKNIQDLTVIHWFLAYATLMAKTCLNIAKSEGSLKQVVTRKEVFTTLAAIIFIPVILIVCTDTAMKTILPINYVTALLVGLNTDYTISIITKVGKSKTN